jgi:hypothetical protein
MRLLRPRMHPRDVIQDCQRNPIRAVCFPFHAMLQSKDLGARRETFGCAAKGHSHGEVTLQHSDWPCWTTETQLCTGHNAVIQVTSAVPPRRCLFLNFWPQPSRRIKFYLFHPPPKVAATPPPSLSSAKGPQSRSGSSVDLP